jgi:hypothetical protein
MSTGVPSGMSVIFRVYLSAVTRTQWADFASEVFAVLAGFVGDGVFFCFHDRAFQSSYWRLLRRTR